MILHREPDTVKYKYENGGLRIFNAIPSDAGRYECCAGVTSQGHFNVKPITLNILCTYWTRTDPARAYNIKQTTYI